MEKKPVDIKMFINEFESVIKNQIPPENGNATTSLLLDVKKYGFIKPKDTKQYEKVLDLLDTANKRTTDTQFRELCLEARKRLQFAINLLRYKKNAQFSTRALASNAGVSHVYIVRLEGCELSIPSTETIKNIARALVVEPTDLYADYKGDKPEFLPQSYQNPIVRKILDELDGFNDTTLEFILKFVKDFKNIQSQNSV